MGSLRIAAVVGDLYHPSEPMVRMLEACLHGMPAELEPYTDTLKLPWERPGEYACLVVAREAKASPGSPDTSWISEEMERNIAGFVQSGGALVALHSGLALYGFAGPYGRTVRGSFLFHPEEHPKYTVRPVGAGHSIGAGLREFELRDEMYFVRVDSRETAVFLEVSSPDYGTSAAAWAHEAGKGRVFCFTPGHTEDTLSDSNYRSVVRAGLSWALGAAQAPSDKLRGMSPAFLPRGARSRGLFPRSLS
jgi:type 1 glutamine amidotransferase